MDHSWVDVIFWTFAIFAIAVTVIVSGFILMEGFNPEYTPGSGWGNSGNHLCDYEACCSIYPADRAWGCDSQGCEATVPNWTHPNCSGGGP